MRLNNIIRALIEIQLEYGDIDVCVIDNDLPDENTDALDICGFEVFAGEEIDDIEDMLAIFVEYEKPTLEDDPD
jgi:hypothetical protein